MAAKPSFGLKETVEFNDELEVKKCAIPNLGLARDSMTALNTRRQILVLSKLVTDWMSFSPDLDEFLLFGDLVKSASIQGSSKSWKPQSFSLSRFLPNHRLYVFLSDSQNSMQVGPYRSLRLAKTQAKRRLKFFIYELKTDSYTLTFSRSSYRSRGK